MKDMNQQNGIQVIARAAAVLRALNSSEGKSLAQLAEAVDLPRSTVQRIVAALISERLVKKSSTQGGLRLGPGLLALAEAARLQSLDVLNGVLREISLKTGETADLSILRENQMEFLDQVLGVHRLRAVSAVGDRFPLINTANGRACLALMTEEQAANHIRAGIARHDEPVKSATVARAVEEARKTGFGYDRDEHTTGISAVGFAFRDPAGDLMAISVPIPTPRFDLKITEVRAALSDARARLET